MGELAIVRDGAVLVRGETIAAVGSRRTVRRAAGTARVETVDAGGNVVLPGFVDSHTHALFAGNRVEEYVARIAGATYEDIGRAGGGIQASAQRLHRAPLAALVRHLDDVVPRFLAHGTTTAEVKSGYGLKIDQELKMLRAIQRAGRRRDLDLVSTLLCHDVPVGLKQDRPRYLSQVIRALLPRVVRGGLAEFFDVFCDRGYFTVEETRTLMTAAHGAGLKLKLHAEQLTHSGAARLAARMNAVSVEHLDYVTVSDASYLEKQGTIATLLPGSTFHLGDSRYAPARMLIDRGVPVALATNFNPGSCPTLNMQMILALACSHMAMSPAEAIVAATVNGAHALARGHRLGTLEVGKQADLAVMRVRDYREIPYFFGMNHCERVVKRGRVLTTKGSV